MLCAGVAVSPVPSPKPRTVAFYQQLMSTTIGVQNDSRVQRELEYLARRDYVVDEAHAGLMETDDEEDETQEHAGKSAERSAAKKTAQDKAIAARGGCRKVSTTSKRKDAVDKKQSTPVKKK